MSRFNYEDILDTYRQLHEQANQANQQRYDAMLDTIGQTQEQVQQSYGQAQQQIAGTHESELDRIEQGKQRQQAGAEQDLISRGLYNTTILNQQQRAAEDDAARQRQEVTDQQSRLEAGLLQDRAQLESQLGQFETQTMEARTDQQPNVDQLMQMIRQGQQAAGQQQETDEPIFTGLSTNARAGRDVWGEPMGGGIGGGGGSGGLGEGDFGFSGGGGGYGGGTSGGAYTVGGGDATGAFSDPMQPGARSSMGTASTIRGDAQQTAGSFDDLFTGQDVYRGGDVVGTYAGNQEVSPVGAELVQDGELETGPVQQQLQDFGTEAEGAQDQQQRQKAQERKKRQQQEEEQASAESSGNWITDAIQRRGAFA